MSDGNPAKAGLYGRGDPPSGGFQTLIGLDTRADEHAYAVDRTLVISAQKVPDRWVPTTCGAARRCGMFIGVKDGRAVRCAANRILR